jgi:hypothetical protein
VKWNANDNPNAGRSHMSGSTRPNARKEANLVDVQEIRRALGKAGSKKEPEHKTHTTKQSQSKSRRDESGAKISESGG